MAFLGCDVFFNFLVDEKEGALRLNACAGVPEEEAADCRNSRLRSHCLAAP